MDRFADEALSLFPYISDEYAAAVAKTAYTTGTEPDPEAAAFAYVAIVAERLGPRLETRRRIPE